MSVRSNSFRLKGLGQGWARWLDIGGRPGATVEGEPERVLLWSWGRRPDADVTLGGDLAAIRAFRARLALATQ